MIFRSYTGWNVMAVLFSVPQKGLVSFKFCIILNLLKQLKAGVSEESLKWYSHSLSLIAEI